ncbi:MAG: 50S ribosomal protein L9 [Desulfobulbaceae bacterium]|jgi:large subunit ribosomal protein L9|nr:50S ribosomal protein L9 [Desulfobulbaceae bacterium]MDY0350940.1 50S ribosomal protein L9 [Desulfobulbaceae bacterium]
MEVILNKTIDNLGLEGEVVNVKPGYARNYLFPQKMAMPKTRENLARLQQEQASIQARLERERKEAESLSARLSGITVQIARRVGEEDRLFGSVTSADIAAKLGEIGIDIDRRAIILNEPIKSIGETMVPVKAGYQITTEITVQVVPEAVGD